MTDIDYEFRVNEEFANLLFRDSEGTRIDSTTRKITISANDPRLIQVGELKRRIKRDQKKFFYFGWDIHFRYSDDELRRAELFEFTFMSYFEPVGEECGTEYDYSESCPECGVPRKQINDLRLDLRKAPKSKDIACTIADDEWIVSQQLAEIMVDAKLTGFELRSVWHKAQYRDDPVDLSTVPSGRELISRAAAVGIPREDWRFDSWLNREENRELIEKARGEYAEQKHRRDRRKWKPLPVWHQLVITSNPIPVVAPTQYGNNPFDLDEDGDYKCPYGHVAGLNLLSEISVSRDGWDRSDLCVTRECTGWLAPAVARAKGLSSGRYPSPQILISPRCRELFLKHKIKGFKTDIAYLR